MYTKKRTAKKDTHTREHWKTSGDDDSDDVVSTIARGREKASERGQRAEATVL